MKTNKDPKGLITQDSISRVTPAMLHHHEKIVKEMFYDPMHPVDVVFNKVEDLSDLSVAARADLSEQQLINIAYVILNNTGKYQIYIREWSRLPPDQKPWAHFKTQFRQAHQELKEAGDLQVRETQFNSANLVQEVIDGVQSALQPQESNDETSEVLQHMANSAAQQQVVPQLMAQMVDLLQKMTVMQQKMSDQQSSTPSLSTTTSSSSRRRRRTNISFYCWSHGACAHPSPDCKSKRPGHQDAATFENKMGGSTAYCVVINDNTN